MNTYFTLTPTARRALCDAALARYCPRHNYLGWLPSAVEAIYQKRIGQTVAVPAFHPAALIVGVWKGFSEWHYRIQVTIGKELMTVYRPCGAI